MKIKRILELLEITNIEIISYGLAPNLFGFCYEIDNECVDISLVRELDILLDSLSSSEEEELRKIIF